MEKLDPNTRAVGIAWIGEENYLALLAIFEDGKEFVGSWKDWVKRAQETEAGLKDNGYIVERVYIDPDTFTEWCLRKGVGTGREARTQFAADFVAKKYGRNQS
jgi:hypothetical protein